MNNSHTLILPSTFQSVELVVDEATTFFAAFFSDDDQLYKIQLLASEAVTNGIEHGNQFDASKNVTVVFVAENDVAVISVEDEGDGFKRKTVSDPLEEANLLEDGGRGLFLMESMADEVRYDQDGRRVTMRIAKSEAS